MSSIEGPLLPSSPTPTPISTSGTPISHLPSELLNQIFTHTLPQKPSFKPTRSPLLLTQVSSHWRSLALSNPGLWGRWSIPDWQELPKDTLELVKLWVGRSGGADNVGGEGEEVVNLDVNIALFNEDVMVVPGSETLQELYKLLQDILSFLKPHRRRILRFRGVFPERLMNDVGIPEMVNAQYIHYCGMLGDNMELQMDLEDADTEEEVNNRVSEHAVLDIGPPRSTLRFLAICGCAANIPSVALQTQLTHLELLDLHRGGELCQETAFSILQSMPLLETCVLDLTKFENQEWEAPEERLVLKNLQLLFVSWVFPADIDMLLKCIAAPKLDKLGLRGTPMVAQRSWMGLHDLLEASRAPISRISLGDFGAVKAEYQRCFAHIPNLVHLTINHTDLSDDFFRVLTPGDPTYNPTLLPNLQIFNMGVCEGFQFDAVVNFLKSRAQNPPEGVQKLTDSAIMYCMSIEERHIPTLQECGVEDLIVEAAENDSAYPYARVVETHRELLAVLYQNEEGEGDGLPPFPNLEEGEEGGRQEDGDAEVAEAEAEGENREQDGETESGRGAQQETR